MSSSGASSSLKPARSPPLPPPIAQYGDNFIFYLDIDAHDHDEDFGHADDDAAADDDDDDAAADDDDDDDDDNAAAVDNDDDDDDDDDGSNAAAADDDDDCPPGVLGKQHVGLPVQSSARATAGAFNPFKLAQ